MEAGDTQADIEVRDAVEGDADRLAELTDAPTDVMRNLVHDRTVRVAQQRPGDGDDEHPLVGFVSYDARRRTVHITQIAGESVAIARLFEEPRRFAANEAMSVELLVAVDDGTLRSAAESFGFEKDGTGPRFEGTRTVRYRLDPN
jgi:hypothetical protein